MMTTAINYSILESPYNSDDVDVTKGYSKSKRLEPKIKQLVKETITDFSSERNLVMRGHNIRVKISIIVKIPLKETRSYSRYNTIAKILRKEVVE